MEDKRQFKRFDFREAVQFRTALGQEPQGCLACDFSAGGLRFRVQEFIALNTELILDITLPNHQVLQTPGRVAWVQRVPHGEAYQVGVAFKAPALQSRLGQDVLAF